MKTLENMKHAIVDYILSELPDSKVATLLSSIESEPALQKEMQYQHAIKDIAASDFDNISVPSNITAGIFDSINKTKQKSILPIGAAVVVVVIAVGIVGASIFNFNNSLENVDKANMNNLSESIVESSSSNNNNNDATLSQSSINTKNSSNYVSSSEETNYISKNRNFSAYASKKRERTSENIAISSASNDVSPLNSQTPPIQNDLLADASRNISDEESSINDNQITNQITNNPIANSQMDAATNESAANIPQLGKENILTANRNQAISNSSQAFIDNTKWQFTFSYLPVMTPQLSEIIEERAYTNTSFSGAYRFSPSNSLGIECGFENYSQEFHSNNSLYSQAPVFFYYGGFWRFSPQKIVIADRLFPYSTLFAGGASSGVILKGQLGLSYRFIQNFYLNASMEYRTMFYKVENTLYSPNNFGVAIGLQFNY